MNEPVEGLAPTEARAMLPADVPVLVLEELSAPGPATLWLMDVPRPKSDAEMRDYMAHGYDVPDYGGAFDGTTVTSDADGGL